MNAASRRAADRVSMPARCSTQPVKAIPPAPPAEKIRVATTPASVSSSEAVQPSRGARGRYTRSVSTT